jgi:hypothetical protein
MRHHHILPKLQQIHIHAGPQLTSQQKAQLETIDCTKKEIMIGAENCYRKWHFGHVAFSLEVSLAIKKVTLWTLVVAKRQGSL